MNPRDPFGVWAATSILEKKVVIDYNQKQKTNIEMDLVILICVDYKAPEICTLIRK